MAPKKKPYSKLSKSAKHYRDNKVSRDKKKKKDTEINSRAAQRKKRTECNTARRKATKAGKNIKGKDFDHATGSFVSSKTNRGRKSGTKGDSRARGRKKK